MLIKRKDLNKLIESLSKRVILEGLGEDILNALISQVGIAKANDLMSTLKNYTKKLSQMERQIRSSTDPEDADGRLEAISKLNLRARDFQGAGLLKSIESKGSGAIRELEEWIGDVDAFSKIPSANQMRSYSSKYAEFSTIVKNLTNSNGEKYRIYFKLSPTSSLKVARELGGSAMCTVSDKSCRNFNDYTKPSKENQIHTKVLVTFEPLDESLKARALKTKYSTHSIDKNLDARDPEDSKKIKDFERAIGIQAVLALGLIEERKKKTSSSDLDWELDWWDDRGHEPTSKEWSTETSRAKFQDAGWYDDLMFRNWKDHDTGKEVKQGYETIKFLYDQTPQSIASLLTPEDLKKILDFSEKRHEGKTFDDREVLNPAEKWINSFPGRKVTMLPPQSAGFSLDDVRSGFGEWSFSGIHFKSDISYDNLNFYDCYFVAESQTTSVSLENCKLFNCTFNDIDALVLNKSYLRNCKFSGAGQHHSKVGSSIQIFGATLDECELTNCFFTNELKLINNVLNNVKFNQCYFDHLETESNSEIYNAKFEKSIINKVILDGESLRDRVSISFNGGAIASFSMFDMDINRIQINKVNPLNFKNIANCKGRLKLDGKEMSQEDLGFGW